MPADTLDFEEPIAVLLKEIEALSMLPRTPQRQSEIDGLNRRIQSIRADIYSHLTAWQQITVARLEAGRDNREPVFAGWPPELDPVRESDNDRVNAWIYEKYRDQTWQSVHYEWRERFLHVLQLAEATPEAVLMEEGRFAWLNGYPLGAVLRGTFYHHHEHREPERRDDAQQAAPEVAPGRRRRARLEAGGDERPVEQEAREDEEQRDARVHAGRERAERVRPREAGAVADVEQHDAERGQRPDAVEQREARVAGRRRDVRRWVAHGGGSLRPRDASPAGEACGA